MAYFFLPPLHDRFRWVWAGSQEEEEEGFQVNWHDPSPELVAAHGNLAEMSNPADGGD